MKYLRAFFGVVGTVALVCLIAAPWFFDWRAGAAVLASFVVLFTMALLDRKEERRMENWQAQAERAAEMAVESLDGWKKSITAAKQWKFDAFIWFFAWVAMSVLCYCFARKLDRLTKNG